jgi:hypothetical protein
VSEPDELALGRALIEMLVADAGFDDLDDAQTRALMVGGLAVTAILRAARDCGLNKIWIVEGVGLALGLIQGPLPPQHATVVRDALDRGFATGLEEVRADRERPAMVLQVIEGGRGGAA